MPIKFLLSFFFSLVFFSDSLACSVFYENREGQYNYERLLATSYEDDWTYESPTAENSIKILENDIDRRLRSERIFIARPEFLLLEATSKSLDGASMGLVKFSPKLVLKGENKKAHWFSKENEIITPVLNPKKLPKHTKPFYEGFMKMLEEQVKGNNSFEFWDDLVIFKQQIIFPPHETSCGIKYVPFFDFNRDYIVFEARNPKFQSSVYIPIETTNDDIVLEIKKALKKEPQRIRKTISAKNYFSKMKYAVPFKLKSCSRKLTNSNTDPDGWWDPYSSFNQSDGSFYERGVEFRALTNEDAQKDIYKALQDDWPALFEYYGDRDQKALECGKGQEFIAFGYQTHGESETRNNWSQIHSSKGDFGTSAYRFAKIVDGNILITSIHTNYVFEDYGTIPLDTVLNWVSKDDFNINQWEAPTP